MQPITINVTIPAPTRRTRKRKIYKVAQEVSSQDNIINTSAVRAQAGGSTEAAPIIIPKDYVEPEVFHKPHREQTMDAFRDQEEVDKVAKYLIDNEMYREYMLFTVGINLGLRYSDLSILRFCDFLNEDGTFKSELPLRSERKTENRKTRNRHLLINDAVKKAITEFLSRNSRNITDYLFENISNNRSAYVDKDGNEAHNPLSVTAISNMVKDMAEAVGIHGKFASHSLRKTFGRLYLINHKDDPTALITLQMIFGHSSPRITMSYIGITADDLAKVYQMNLGLLDDSEQQTMEQYVAGEASVAQRTRNLCTR